MRDFTRRFWWTLQLTLIVFVLAMFGHRLQWMEMAVQSWVELVIATPIVLWAGWPFFARGWKSVLNRTLNMWTLLGLAPKTARRIRPDGGEEDVPLSDVQVGDALRACVPVRKCRWMAL